VAQKALENQITLMKEEFKKEPITGSKKPEILDIKVPDQDN